MFLTAYELIKRFPDEASAQKYLEFVRWRGKPVCPRCGETKQQYKQMRQRIGGYYRCGHCLLVYTVRTGTLFERSHVPLDKWLVAIYRSVKCKHAISPMILARELDITPKTAGQLLQRIESFCSGNPGHFLKTEWACLFEKPNPLTIFQSVEMNQNKR
jgi:transposase-like protein